MTSNNLQHDLESRVRAFIQDYYEWQCFVVENFRERQMDSEVASKYRALIDKYCAPGKTHQGLVLSGAVEYLPENQHIVKFEQSGDIAIVYTEVRHTAPPKEGYIDPHEFEFKLSGEDWFLDELYFNDGSGRYECL